MTRCAIRLVGLDEPTDSFVCRSTSNVINTANVLVLASTGSSQHLRRLVLCRQWSPVRSQLGGSWALDVKHEFRPKLFFSKTNRFVDCDYSTARIGRVHEQSATLRDAFHLQTTSKKIPTAGNAQRDSESNSSAVRDGECKDPGKYSELTTNAIRVLLKHESHVLRPLRTVRFDAASSSDSTFQYR